jgi:hypothetical protein
LPAVSPSTAKDVAPFLYNHCRNIEIDYQSGAGLLRFKDYADLIYAHASFISP